MDIATLSRSVVYQRYKVSDFDSVLYGFKTSLLRTTQYSSIGYDNPQIFKLHEYTRTAINPDEHSAIYRQIMAIHSQDIPHTFLYPRVDFYVVHKNIRGLSSPFRANPYRYVEHLWIEEED
jgi:ABC-type transport system substrate-binding protein